jgi:hypothetical protein
MPIVYAVFAYFFYASQAYVLEQKTSSYTPAALLVQLYLVGLTLSGIYLLVTKASGATIAWPSGSALKWVVIGGVVFFLADNLYVLAYYTAQKSGEEYLFAIVGAAILFPVFGTVIKYLWTEKLPNGWHFAAYGVAVIMLGLVIMGNKVERDRETRRKAAAAAMLPAAQAPSETP